MICLVALTQVHIMLKTCKTLAVVVEACNNGAAREARPTCNISPQGSEVQMLPAQCIGCFTRLDSTTHCPGNLCRREPSVRVELPVHKASTCGSCSEAQVAKMPRLVSQTQHNLFVTRRIDRFKAFQHTTHGIPVSLCCLQLTKHE